jgi:hypothetical protein
MRTKWYVDAEIDRYSIAHFERCLREVCHNFGIPELKKTGRMETDGFYHKSEFLFPNGIDEESFDEMLNDFLASAEPEYYQE